MFHGFQTLQLAWAPESDSDLGRFGVAWSGWCMDHGERHPRAIVGREMPSAQARSTCRGFQAPLGAPIPIRSDRTAWQVQGAIATAADQARGISIPGLHVRAVGSRLGLAPTTSATVAELVELVAALLQRVPGAGPFPGPGGSGAMCSLAPPQWPWLGLAEGLEPEEAQRVAHRVTARIAPLLLAPRRIDEISLLGDPGNGRGMRVIERYRLNGVSDEELRRGVIGRSTLAVTG